MNRWIAFAAVFLLAAAALVLGEKRKPQATVGPDAFLYFIADTERELTRLPAAFTRISDQDEIEVGNRLAGRYARDRFNRLSDEERTQAQLIAAYVERVGGRVAGRAHRKLPYKFHYIPDPEFINAFALPGRHVFIGAGLIALIDTEDELAAVLGHEVEHIDHYHCAERIQREAVLRKIPLGQLLDIPLEVFVAGYTKDQELEADREGTRLAVLASYSPQGAIRMFETFGRLHEEHVRHARSPQEELSQVALQTLEGYFRSHPAPAERAERIRRMIDEERWGNLPPERNLEVAYIFLTARAQAALTGKKYLQAAGLATHSLELHPGQPKALKVLAEAKFALRDFSTAAKAYRELVEKSPPAAADVGSFAASLAAQALKEKNYQEAAMFASGLLELQPLQPDALKVLAQAQLGLADLKGLADTYLKLKRMYPQQARELRDNFNAMAAQAFSEKHYEETATMAAHVIMLEPGQARMIKLLADSQFALADFEAAATAYRELLELGLTRGKMGDAEESEKFLIEPGGQLKLSLIQAYADALGAVRPPQKGVAEFQNFVNLASSRDAAFMTRINVELAGLNLMAGDEGPTNALRVQAERPDSGGIAPEFFGRLGWWYRRAGKPADSHSLVEHLVNRRPGDLSLVAGLAWAELEAEGNPDSATQKFTFSLSPFDYSSPQGDSPLMGRAIARWQARQTEQALADFDSAVKALPQWLNPKWVNALYPLNVARSVAEMQADRDRRLEAARRRTGPGTASGNR